MFPDDNLRLTELLHVQSIKRAREILMSSDYELSKMAKQTPGYVLDRMICGLMSQIGPKEDAELAQRAAERLANFRDLSADNAIYKIAN